MNIVLDSNAIIPDFFLDKPHHILFRNYLNKSMGDKLRIPRIVIEEVKNKYKEEYSEGIKKMRMVEPEYRAETETNYEKYPETIDRILGSFNAEYLPYPQVSHEEMIKRDLNKRKPFKANGGGYRDALIWKSILEFMKKGNVEVIFLTDNYKDFCCSDKDNKAHPDLCKDLQRLGIPVKNFRIIRNIESFNEEIVIPKLQKLGMFEKNLYEDTYPYLNIVELIEANGKTITNIIDWEVDGGFVETKGLYYSNIVSIPEIDLVSVHEIENGQLFIECQANMLIEFNFNVSGYKTGEYFAPRSGWIGQDGGPIKIVVNCSIVLDEESKSVSAFKVESVKRLE